MSLREKFVTKARQEGVRVSALCQEFGISRQTGYKWLRRYGEAGVRHRRGVWRYAPTGVAGQAPT